MTLRSVRRRWEPTDLETALKMVSRAERRALERAEELRVEAERLMRSVSTQAVAVESKVRGEFAVELGALRDELEASSRRTTVAEVELDLLRAAGAEARSDRRAPTVAPLRPLSGEADPAAFAVTAEATATRIHAEAQLALARAQEEAVRILTAATDQAKDLLSMRVTALERDAAVITVAREQAERDAERAATLRSQAEEMLDAARSEAQAVLDGARVDAQEVVKKARQEAAEVMLAVRRQLIEELLSLRAAMDRARRSLESFVDATGAQGVRTDATGAEAAAPPQGPSNVTPASEDP